MLSQLPLPLSLSLHETFDSFYVGNNAQLVSEIKHAISETHFHYIYFWSAHSVGRTHLLYAACHQVTEQGQTASYVPLEQFQYLSTEMLQGMEQCALVCLDNLDAIAGNKEWEIAIFDLFNRIYEQQQTTLLITGSCAPRQLPLTLPDLSSRLNWGNIYQLQTLNDDEKKHALQQRARLKGIDLSDDVSTYLVHHLSRDMKILFLTLDELDRASLSSKRKLTIPFVKESLSLKQSVK